MTREKHIKINEDKVVRSNLGQIVKGVPDLLDGSVQVSIEREKLCSDMADLIRRLPLSEKQDKILYDAISARYQHRNCYKCLKLKCVLGGEWVYPDGDLSKPKRFVCGECK